MPSIREPYRNINDESQSAIVGLSNVGAAKTSARFAFLA